MDSNIFSELELSLFNHDEEESGKFFLRMNKSKSLNASGFFRGDDSPSIVLTEGSFESFLDFLENNFRFNTVDFTLTITPLNSKVALVYSSERTEQNLVALSFSENRPFVSDEVISACYSIVLSISKALNISYPAKLELIAVAVDF